MKGRTSPCCGIPSLRESLHCKNVSYIAEHCTKNFVSAFHLPEIHLPGPAGHWVYRKALRTQRQTYRQTDATDKYTDAKHRHTAHGHTKGLCTQVFLFCFLGFSV